MAKVHKIESSIPKMKQKKKVAAYARVSMETEMLHHSLSAQISHYSSLIQSNPEWEYVGVFADEGISGTSTKRRYQFNLLMKACDEGEVDLILVKSISRFARDTLDTLNATRHLKDIGVDVYFERENIHSISGEGELLLTLLASFAQAEAESISANEKWSVQKHFEKGEPNTSLRCFGYDWHPDTKSLTINEEEGKWVKYIYAQYLAGASIKGLALDLKEKNVCGVRGSNLTRATIRRILTSKTYVGDVILQKYFNPSIRKPKINEGEVDQILITDNHEPLVSREDFAKVQERIKIRAESAYNAGYKKTYFAGMVKCGKCGHACNHVLHHSKEIQYEFIKCNKRKTKECDLLPIRESELKAIMEQVVGDKKNVKQIILYDDHIDFILIKGGIKTYIREYPKGSYKKTPFSRKVYCGYCGASIVKMGNKNRVRGWICNSKKGDRNSCIHHYMREEELYHAAIEILGIDENIEMQIYLNIEKTVSYNDRIEFYMKTGDVKVWQRQSQEYPQL